MPLTIAPGIEIPDEELSIVASRSGGPGGQHVNKTSSRIAIRFDVAHSPSLPADARARILERLRTRIAADGSVRVVAQDARSQHANRRTAMARLEALLAGALVRAEPRLPTRVSRAAKARRVDAKKRRSGIKRTRAASRERSEE
ncbi:MAG TPA: alternative ribosome rescue aminoacyl-tRNA hydrolase ArfB [Candidatus Sulfotelmatobacter sp.]|jgi:ribosome-associated protein|nr:alternative ribosome rescue aminoacyl-tRNA hydrolase ArfB [Candidatus Sulfotelmatobacter sp.]